MVGTWRVHIRRLNISVYGLDGATGSAPKTDWPLSEPDLVYFQDTGDRFWPGSWMIGATFIHWDEAYGNKGLAAEVVGYNLDGSGYVESLDLASEIFAAGGLTWSLMLFPSLFTKVFPQTDDEITDITRYVTGINFGTDIRRGFAEATIEIDKSTSYVSKFFAQAGGYNVMIYDNYGEPVYEGIILQTEMSGMGGRLDCFGYSKTNDFYYGEGDSAMYIQGDQLLNVDWSDELHDAQETDGTYNGIGPFDFDETPTTLTEIFDNVTKFGFYPADPYKDWYVNIWYDRILQGHPVPKTPGDGDDAHWTLTERNFSDDLAGVSVTISFEDFVNSKRLVYTGVDGETVRTQSAFNHPYYHWFGIMEGSATSQTLSADRAYDILRESTAQPINMQQPGEIVVSGNAWVDGTSWTRPVHHIKAGDIIEIILPASANYPYPTSIQSGQKYVVGKTSYNVNEGTMSIEVYGKADVIERQLMVSDFKEA